ncbi:MAG TPA: tetratricopeptide repeat protein [Bdellovibrionales bacterium]|nr:tetratricopeptide repeat protein [Bdellovibrionales bacterium]
MKNILRAAAIISAVSLLQACATAPADKKTAQAPAKVYSRSVASMGLNQVQASSCPKTMKSQEFYAKSDWKELIGLANACVKGERWAHVEAFAEMLSIRDPKAPWGAYYWALAAEYRNDMARALWMIELAVKKAPDVGILHFQKGRLLWKEDSHSPAMEALVKAVQLDGSLTEAHVFLGQIYFRDQEYAKSTQHFYTALQSRPSDPIALSGLAESRLQAGDTSGAIEAMKRASLAYPDRYEFPLREAYIFETVLGDKVQALQAYKTAMGIISSKRIKGATVSTVEKKIAELEKVTRQPTSAVADKKAPVPEVKR